MTHHVEFRRRRGWDLGIPFDVALVHEVRPNGLSFLLSPQLTVGGPAFVTPAGDLRVTLDAIGPSTGVARLTIATRIEQEPARCPQIRGEIAAAEAAIAALQDELQTAPRDRSQPSRRGSRACWLGSRTCRPRRRASVANPLPSQVTGRPRGWGMMRR